MTRKFVRIADSILRLAYSDDFEFKTIETVLAGWSVKFVSDTNSEINFPTIEFIRKYLGAPPKDFNSFEIAFGGVCRTNGREYYIADSGSAVYVNSAEPVTVKVRLDRSETASVDAAFRRVISIAFQFALRRCGLFDLHASALVSPASKRAILFAGKTGSGKSTLAAVLASRGWFYLSDDSIVLDKRNKKVAAFSLRGGFGLKKSSLENLSVAGLLEKGEDFFGLDGKRRFAPAEIFPAGYTESAVPDVIFFPTITGEKDSRLAAISKREAFENIIRVCPWACYDQPVAPHYIKILRSLVEQCENYNLFCGTDLLNPKLADKFFRKYV